MFKPPFFLPAVFASGDNVAVWLAGGLRERRHRGIPGGQARQTLLHRSQLPAPGGAHGH